MFIDRAVHSERIPADCGDTEMEAVGSNWTHDQLVPSDVIPLSYISTSLHCWSHELMLHTVCTPWTVRWVLDSAAFIRVPDVVLSAWSSLANSLKTHSQGDFSHRTDTGDVLFLLLSVWTLSVSETADLLWFSQSSDFWNTSMLIRVAATWLAH